MNIYTRQRVKELDFKGTDTKYATHGFHNYPAMMVGPVAKYCINKYLKSSQYIIDPFVGSGSVLVEASLSGRKSIGIDLNPLAVLISSVKTKILDYNKLTNYKIELEEMIDYYTNNYDEIDTDNPLNINLHNQEFWFKPHVFNELSQILYCINNLYMDQPYRDFFIVILSETIREASNTRNGEFKLYRMTKDKLDSWNPNPFKLFINKMERNYSNYKKYLEVLPSNHVEPEVRFGDSRFISNLKDKNIDGVLTSPPYGDSRTTVAYGQFSRLSSDFLNLGKDKIIPQQIDSHLLGGSRSKKNELTLQDIGSKILDKTHDIISNKDEKRAREVHRFYQGYYEVIEALSDILNDKSEICYVVGNRTVKSTYIETDKITKEIFEQFGYRHTGTYIRDIPNKRMPSKNSPTNIKGEKVSTMVNEFIVTFKR